MLIRHLVPGSFRPRTKTKSFRQTAQVSLSKSLLQEKERLDPKTEQQKRKI